MAKRTQKPDVVVTYKIPGITIRNRAEAARFMTVELHDLLQMMMDLAGSGADCGPFLESLMLDFDEVLNALSGMMERARPIEIHGELGDSLGDIVGAIKGLEARVERDHLSFTTAKGHHGEVGCGTWQLLNRLAKIAAEKAVQEANARWNYTMEDRVECGNITVEVERLQRRQRWLKDKQRPDESLKPTEKFVPGANRESEEKTT